VNTTARILSGAHAVTLHAIHELAVRTEAQLADALPCDASPAHGFLLQHHGRFARDVRTFLQEADWKRRSPHACRPRGCLIELNVSGARARVVRPR
jgi:hypothetical protein